VTSTRSIRRLDASIWTRAGIIAAHGVRPTLFLSTPVYDALFHDGITGSGVRRAYFHDLSLSSGFHELSWPVAKFVLPDQEDHRSDNDDCEPMDSALLCLQTPSFQWLVTCTEEHLNATSTVSVLRFQFALTELCK